MQVSVYHENVYEVQANKNSSQMARVNKQNIIFLVNHEFQLVKPDRV
jgi:hypothetical protein